MFHVPFCLLFGPTVCVCVCQVQVVYFCATGRMHLFCHISHMWKKQLKILWVRDLHPKKKCMCFFSFDLHPTKYTQPTSKV